MVPREELPSATAYQALAINPARKESRTSVFPLNVLRLVGSVRDAPPSQTRFPLGSHLVVQNSSGVFRTAGKRRDKEATAKGASRVQSSPEPSLPSGVIQSHVPTDPQRRLGKSKWPCSLLKIGFLLLRSGHWEIHGSACSGSPGLSLLSCEMGVRTVLPLKVPVRINSINGYKELGKLAINVSDDCDN